MYKEEQDYFRWVGNRKICLIFGQHIVDGISYNVTSRYLNTMASTCQVCGKVLRFVIIGATHVTVDFLCFPWQPLSVQCLQSLHTPSNCFSVLLTTCVYLLSFCIIVAGLL